MAEKEINTIMYGVHRDCTACSAKSTEFQLGITPTASSSRTAKKKKAGANGEGVLAVRIGETARAFFDLVEETLATKRQLEHVAKRDDPKNYAAKFATFEHTARQLSLVLGPIRAPARCVLHRRCLGTASGGDRGSIRVGWHTEGR